jgi:NhaA family Na+:H+ antiporter
MIFPALVYLWFNAHDPSAFRGWATPVATDIAFALGVLSLFGRRVPAQLKLFLLALAIFDDLGAILIIAIYFTTSLSWVFLGLGVMTFFMLVGLNRRGVTLLLPYLILGTVLWLTLLKTGIHPTIAGVLLALTIPAGKKIANSPLYKLENALHPWVAYIIMPLFALVNAGFSLEGMSIAILADQVVLGIMLGLFLGKQLGVLGFAWALIRLKWAELPAKSSWLTFYGVCLLCGIGFTMSLFLGTLAFEKETAYLAQVRLGVIMGSILSSFAGAMVLLIAFARKRSSIVD